MIDSKEKLNSFRNIQQIVITQKTNTFAQAAKNKCKILNNTLKRFKTEIAPFFLKNSKKTLGSKYNRFHFLDNQEIYFNSNIEKQNRNNLKNSTPPKYQNKYQNINPVNSKSDSKIWTQAQNLIDKQKMPFRLNKDGPYGNNIYESLNANNYFDNQKFFYKNPVKEISNYKKSDSKNCNNISNQYKVNQNQQKRQEAVEQLFPHLNKETGRNSRKSSPFHDDTSKKSSINNLNQFKNDEKNLHQTDSVHHPKITEFLPDITKSTEVLHLKQPSLVNCRYCKRKFSQSRIDKHEGICELTCNVNRTKYDATKHRAKGTDLESFAFKKTMGFLRCKSGGSKKSMENMINSRFSGISKSTRSSSLEDTNRIVKNFNANQNQFEIIENTKIKKENVATTKGRSASANINKKFGGFGDQSDFIKNPSKTNERNKINCANNNQRKTSANSDNKTKDINKKSQSIHIVNNAKKTDSKEKEPNKKLNSNTNTKNNDGKYKTHGKLESTKRFETHNKKGMLRCSSYCSMDATRIIK